MIYEMDHAGNILAAHWKKKRHEDSDNIQDMDEDTPLGGVSVRPFVRFR
jgi:hypothetical protein